MLQLIITFFLPLLLLLLIFSLSRPATKNPCPDSYPLIGNIIAFLRNYHRFHDWITQMLSTTPSASLQVNSFLNISNGVGTSNPANIQHILHTNFDNYIKGTRFHNVLHEFLGDGIFNADGQIWTFQRKIASHEFSTKSLKLFISDVVLSEVSDHLLPFLDEKSEEGQVFDLQQVLHKFAFRSICRVAFGVDPESILPNLDFMKSFDDAVETCFARFTSPFPAYWKLKRFLNLGSEKHFKQSIRAINEFAFHVIESKEDKIRIEKNDKNQQEDLLGRFMVWTSERHKFLRDIIISFVLAGKDTTSTALTWFFWLIAGNPRCADLIHRELSAAAAAFGYDKLKRLDYVHAALSESMRLFPPVPLNSKLAVDDDVWPDGTQVRKGWFADYSAYAVGRMEKVWGPDCMEFKPERWLEEGRYKPSDQFKYPVFHCGPRMCLGKEMAYIQMKAIVAAVMMEYEVLAIDGGASVEKMVNPPYTLSLLLKMRGGLPVRIKRRL
ncbi:Cytochrome P450 94A1 [Linum perenne]